MSKFYVGQRVRIVKSTSRHFGKSATIEEVVTGAMFHDFIIDRITDEPILYRVITEDGVTTVNDGVRLAFPPSWIEPLDDSRELTTWSQCVWKPNTVRA